MSVDICFVCSPMNLNATVPPYHYLYLGAYLEKEKITYEILDEKCEMLLPRRVISKLSKGSGFSPQVVVVNKIIEKLKEIRPKIVGLAVYTSDYNCVMDLARLIKENIGCAIVVGNAHASVCPNDFIFEGSDIDYVVRGEGEATLTELIKALKTGSPVDEIAGIAYLKNGQPVFGPTRSLLSDLSIDLTSAYKKIRMEHYIKPSAGYIRSLIVRAAGVHTGRGCPFSCKFCAANVIWATHGPKRSVRFRPISDVINELGFLRDTYHINGFVINDDTFTVRKERVYDFCEKMKRAKIDLIWAAQSRVNQIDEDMLRAMKDAGCIQIEFGIESASPKCLEEVDKRIKVESAYKGFDICRKVGIRTFANMLINIPGETEEDIQLSEDFLRKVRPTEVGWGITTPYPGTGINEKYIKPKLSKEEYPLLFANRMLGSDRLRLCHHTLDLEVLINKLIKRHRYGLKILFVSFSFDRAYIKTLHENVLGYFALFFKVTITRFLEGAWYTGKRLAKAWNK